MCFFLAPCFGHGIFAQYALYKLIWAVYMISVNFMAFVGLSRAGPPEASDFPWRSYGVDMGSEKLMGVLILGNSRER